MLSQKHESVDKPFYKKALSNTALFQGTCSLLALIGQLLIVLSHHVYCTCCKITLHNFGKKYPTHKVHLKDLKTNHKK